MARRCVAAWRVLLLVSLVWLATARLAAGDCESCDLSAGQQLSQCQGVVDSSTTQVWVPTGSCSRPTSGAVTARLNTLLSGVSPDRRSPNYTSQMCSTVVRGMLCAFIIESTQGGSQTTCFETHMCYSDCLRVKECLIDPGDLACIAPLVSDSCNKVQKLPFDTSSDPSTDPTRASSSTGSDYVAPSYTIADGISLPPTVAIATSGDDAPMANLTFIGRNVSGIAVYEGIPYIMPSAGNSRWKGPIMASKESLLTQITSANNDARLRALGVPSANRDGNLFAFTTPGSKCFQRHATIVGKFDGNEDCLYMNIATPYLNFTSSVYNCTADPCVPVNSALIGRNLSSIVYVQQLVNTTVMMNTTVAVNTSSVVNVTTTVGNHTSWANQIVWTMVNQLIEVPTWKMVNVSVPTTVWRVTPVSTVPPLLPVLVYLHGGNFANGSAADLNVTDMVRQSISLNASMVVVTFNYRIGVFGFLAHKAFSSERTPLETSGLYGLEDQRAALKFVRAHIASFGGDPYQVTLMGEGSGAVMACMHIFADPKINFLFKRAILQDGSCANLYRTLPTSETKVGEPYAKKMAELTGNQDCGYTAVTKVADCLRKASTETLYQAYLDLGCDRHLDPDALTMGPLIDGSIYNDYMANSLLAERYLPVTVLLGGTTMQLAPFIGGQILDNTKSPLFVDVKSLKDITDSVVAAAASNLVQHAANDYLPKGFTAPSTANSSLVPGGGDMSTLWSTSLSLVQLRQDYSNLDDVKRVYDIDLYADPTLENLHLDVLTSLYTDYHISCPSIQMANGLAAKTPAGASSPLKVYMYRFSYQSFQDPDQRFGAATAGSLMPYLLGKMTTGDSQDANMANEVQYRWFNFMHSGNPTPDKASAIATGLTLATRDDGTDPAWQEFKVSDHAFNTFTRTTIPNAPVKVEMRSLSQASALPGLATECQIWDALAKPGAERYYYIGRKPTGSQFQQFDHCEQLPSSSYCAGILSYSWVNLKAPFACLNDVEHFLLQMPPIVAALNNMKTNWQDLGWPALLLNTSLPHAQVAQACIDDFVFAVCRLLYRPCKLDTSVQLTGYDITQTNLVSGWTSAPCGRVCHNYRFSCPLSLVNRRIQPVFDLYLPEPLSYVDLFGDCTNTGVWTTANTGCSVISSKDANPATQSNCSCYTATTNATSLQTQLYAPAGRTLMAEDDSSSSSSSSTGSDSSTGSSNSTSSSTGSDSSTGSSSSSSGTASVEYWWSVDTIVAGAKSSSAPVCVTYTGSACAGIINYPVYVPTGQTLASLEAQANLLDLVPLQLLSTVHTGCRESFSRHICSKIFRRCDPYAQQRVATVFGLSRFDDLVPYPRNPCRYICEDAQNQCSDLFVAAPQARAYVNCTTSGIYTPRWTLCDDPEMNDSRYPNQRWVVPADYPLQWPVGAADPNASSVYPVYYNTMEWAPGAFIDIVVGGVTTTISTYNLSSQCNDFDAGIARFFSTNVTINCPYPLLRPDNFYAPTFEGGSCALPCASLLWTDEQWSLGDSFFLACVLIGFVMSLWLFVSYTLFPINRQRSHLHMFFVSVFCLSAIYLMQIAYSSGKAHTFGCKNNTEPSRQEDEVLCTLAGAAFMYFINASVQWWMVMSLDLFNSLVRKKKYTMRELAWQRRAYHAIAWGMPLIFVIVAAGQQSLGRTSTLPWCFMSDDTTVATEWGIMWIPLLIRLLLGLFFMFRVAYTMYQQGSIVERNGTGNRWGWFKMQRWMIALVLFFCFVFLWLIVYRFYMLLNSDAFTASLNEWIMCLIYAKGACGEKPKVYPVSLIWYGMIACVGAQGIACGLFFGFERRNFVLWAGFLRGKGRDYFTRPDVDLPTRAEKLAKAKAAFKATLKASKAEDEEAEPAKVSAKAQRAMDRRKAADERAATAKEASEATINAIKIEMATLFKAQPTHAVRPNRARRTVPKNTPGTAVPQPQHFRYK